MFYLTSIARATDGLIYVSSVVRKSEVNKEIDSDAFRAQSKSIFKTLSSNSPPMLQITADEYCYTYIIEDNICYLTLTEKTCSKKLCFSYLEDIKKSFIQFLETKYQDEWRTQLSTIAMAYYFYRFEKEILSKRTIYENGNVDEYAQLNDNLIDIQNIMKKNINEVMTRVEKLDSVQNISENLVAESKKYSWGAKKLNYVTLLRKYAPLVVLVLFILIILYWRVFRR
ncbi:hypothetical protein WA158_006705 [Blastocystis sp. Blastoise]